MKHPKNRSLALTLSSLLLGAGLIGCAARSYDFSIISTRNAELGVRYVKAGASDGKSTYPVILFPMGQPNMKDAVDDCLKKKNGDLLTNAVFRFYNRSFFFGVVGVEVTGDVWVKAGSAAASEIPNEETFELKVGANGHRRLVSTTDGSHWAAVVDTE